MDFKGHKGTEAAIGPLSVLAITAAIWSLWSRPARTRYEAVRERLEGVLRAHGVPDAMRMDHGVPWWNGRVTNGWSQLSIWLMSQGIRCCYSGVLHPHTQGQGRALPRGTGTSSATPRRRSLARPAMADAFRTEYNELRPHEALAMQPPASRWQPSSRSYDPHPPAWDYGDGAELRKVNSCGYITINDTPWK